MAEVDAAIVFLPRFTTLVGGTTYTTKPLDVSRFGSAQFQLWRGPLIGSGGSFLCYLEESLDAEHWVLGPSTPQGYDPGTDDPTLTRPKLFSYGFRLRWFRLRIVVDGSNAATTCWAEGLLRDGGGGGAWSSAQPATGAPNRSSAGSGMSFTSPVVSPPPGGPSHRGDQFDWSKVPVAPTGPAIGVFHRRA